MLSVGTYPDTTLKSARLLRVIFNDLLKQGVDPSQHRKQKKHIAIAAAENSFESVARLWWEHWKHARTERHAAYTLRRIEADVFPMIGDKPVNSITAMNLLATIKKLRHAALPISLNALSAAVARYFAMRLAMVWQNGILGQISGLLTC